MSDSGRSIVVNADDLGISEAVNNAIFDCHDQGVVSSATLLVGGPAVEHALRGAKERPLLGVGLHLDTSEFPPMSPAFAEVRRSNPTLDVRQTKAMSPSLVRAVLDEWTAQLDAARDLGVDLTHLDSHHFDHVNPLLLPVIGTVVRTSGVKKVRGMHNLWVESPSWPVVAVKKAHRTAMRYLGATTTSYMCDVGSFLTLAAADRLPSDGTFELMAHPGHPSYDGETMRLLADGAAVFGHDLVNWRQLNG